MVQTPPACRQHATPCDDLSVRLSPPPSQGLDQAMQRGARLVASCAAMGPLYAIFNDAAISMEFVNCTVDMSMALSKVRQLHAGACLPACLPE